jgi:hypothetical protein
MKRPFRNLDDRTRLVLHIIYTLGVPSSVAEEFYDTSKAHRLRKMFYQHYKKVQSLGGYEEAWDATLTPEEKVAFQPHRSNR